MPDPDGPDYGDDQLIERAQAGDLDAYGALVVRYSDLAVRVAATVAGPDADPEASAQEAFVKAFQALQGFRRGAPFRQWLLAIVANQARNQRRSTKRRDGAVERFRLTSREPHFVPSAETVALRAQDNVELLAALGRLNEQDRIVLSFRFLHELTEQETAHVLGVAKGTVKSRQSRALQRLRKEMLIPEAKEADHV